MIPCQIDAHPQVKLPLRLMESLHSILEAHQGAGWCRARGCGRTGGCCRRTLGSRRAAAGPGGGVASSGWRRPAALAKRRSPNGGYPDRLRSGDVPQGSGPGWWGRPPAGRLRNGKGWRGFGIGWWGRWGRLPAAGVGSEKGGAAWLLCWLLRL